MTSSKRRRSLAAAFGVAAALVLAPAWADSADELARLREDAAQLRRSLEQLEARIHALEARQRERQDRDGSGAAGEPPRAARPPAPASAPEPPLPSVSSLLSLKQSWSQIEAGAPEEKVRTLLGKPERVLAIDGNVVWYYAYPGVGPGSVFFNRQGKVTSFRAPSFGW